MYYIFLIHSSVYGYLVYFHVLATVNRAAVNIGGMFLWKRAYIRICAQEWDCWLIWQFYIYFLESLNPGWTNLHTHQHCRRVHLPPHPLQDS